MSYTLAPYVFWQSFDGIGDPLALGSVSVYLAGTSTPTPTYADPVGTPNAWPVPLDSEGRAVIYLDPAQAYKFLLKDAAGVVIPGGTRDGVAPVGAGTSGVGPVFVFGGNPSAAVTNTSYPIGATFDTLHPGTAVFAEDPANLVGTYRLQATGLMVGSGTLTVALVNLSDGAPDTPIATATITSPTGELAVSALIVPGAPGVVKSYGIKARVDAGMGFAWGIMLMRIS